MMSIVYIHELRFTQHARLGGNCMCHTNRCTSVCCIHDKTQQFYLHVLGFMYESTIGTSDWCQLLFSTNILFYYSNKIRIIATQLLLFFM